MPRKTDIYWVKPPKHLASSVDDYGKKGWQAVEEVAQFIGQKMQDAARSNAPWQDRTGNARSGLFNAVEEEARNVVAIYLSHTMDYGVYLELSKGGRYAIIMKTIEQHLPELKRMLDRIFS